MRAVTSSAMRMRQCCHRCVGVPGGCSPLTGRPGLVVADEPTSALDADRQQAFIDLLLEECAAAGAALLFVSHDTRLAAHFDRVLDLAALNYAALNHATSAAEGAR